MKMLSLLLALNCRVDASKDAKLVPLKTYYKIEVNDELSTSKIKFFVTKAINRKTKECINEIDIKKNLLFDKIEMEEYNDEIFKNLFVNIVKDLISKYLRLRSGRFFIKGEENEFYFTFLEKNLEVAYKMYPNERSKVKKYVESIISYLDIKGNELFQDPFTRRKKEMDEILKNESKDLEHLNFKKEKLLKELFNIDNLLIRVYQTYIDKMNRKNSFEIKKEIKCMIMEHIRNNYVKELEKELLSLLRLTRIYIKDNELDFVDSSANLSKDERTNANTYLKNYNLRTKYVNGVLYIENVPIKLIKHELKV